MTSPETVMPPPPLPNPLPTDPAQLRALLDEQAASAFDDAAREVRQRLAGQIGAAQAEELVRKATTRRRSAPALVGVPGPDGKSRDHKVRLPSKDKKVLAELARSRGGDVSEEIRAAVADILARPPAAGEVPAKRPYGSGYLPVTWYPAAGQEEGLKAVAAGLGVDVTALVRFAVGRYLHS